jgi:hypothetical protein
MGLSRFVIKTNLRPCNLGLLRTETLFKSSKRASTVSRNKMPMQRLRERETLSDITLRPCANGSALHWSAINIKGAGRTLC